jgi:hypothetical protein
MKERRKTARASCRLPCRVIHSRGTARSRIVDVSEGGLCLLSPSWLKPKEEVDIAIDVPGTGVSSVRVEIWHVRREQSGSSGNRVWVIGASLLDADAAYAKLLRATGAVAAAESAAPSAESTPSAIDSVEPRAFRIRCKANGGPRSRVLTLAAESEDEARSIAVRDLGSAWTVLEIREA